MRIRRVVLTVAAYIVVASLVLGAARTVAEILVLPPLFLTLLAAIVVVGLPVAAGLAWTYRGPGEGE